MPAINQTKSPSKKLSRKVFKLNLKTNQLVISIKESNLWIEIGDEAHAYLDTEGFWHKEPDLIELENKLYLKPSTPILSPHQLKQPSVTYMLAIPEYFNLDITMQGGIIQILDLKGNVKLNITPTNRLEGRLSAYNPDLLSHNLTQTTKPNLIS